MNVDFDFEAMSANPEFVAAFSNLHLESARVVSFADNHLKNLELLEARIAEARGVAPILPGS